MSEERHSSIDDIIEELKSEVDVTLIDENLRRPPEERLRKLVQMQQLVAEMRAATGNR